MRREHSVAIVLDEKFGPRLLLLSQRMHVWAIESAPNRRAFDEFLRLRTPVPDDPLQEGITTFRPEGSTPSERLLEILECVEDHHGEYAHDPPWTRLLIYGLFDGAEVEQALMEYGVTEITPKEFGLEARRPAAGGGGL